jgi:hypothetical protein
MHFQVDWPETVQQVALPGDKTTSYDLKNAFNHLRVHAEMQPFLRFAFEGRCYNYVAMPFGAKHSPRLFTEALGCAAKYILTRGWWCIWTTCWYCPRTLRTCAWRPCRSQSSSTTWGGHPRSTSASLLRRT